MAKKRRIGYDPLAWIRSTVEPTASEEAASSVEVLLNQERGEQIEFRQQQYSLIAISAKTGDALKEKMQDLVEWIDEDGSSYRLEDMAFTLLVGRTHFPQRAAFIVDSVEGMKAALQAVLAGKSVEGYIPTVKRTKIDPAWVQRGDALMDELARATDAVVDLWTEFGQLYVNGCNLDWTRLYATKACRRLSMPTYPFAKERYWLNGEAVTTKAPTRIEPHTTATVARLHPLIESNCSTIHGLKFVTTLHGDEAFLMQNAGAQLPGALFLEMARAGGELAADSPVVRLHQMIWAKPVDVQVPITLALDLWPHGEQLHFEVNSIAGVHCQGSLSWESEAAAPEFVDLEGLKQRIITRHEADADPAVLSVGIGSGEAYAQLKTVDVDGFGLHPALVQAAFWTAAQLANAERQKPRAYSPYSLERATLSASLGAACHLYVRAVGEADYDLLFLDESGRVLAKLSRYAHKPTAKVGVSSDVELLDLLRRLQQGEVDVHETKRLAGGI